ncbi:hypothetical protein F4805DRAFT_456859 [Annulohypoxylon moriforme]|nr:hypothetical protein F4805DRAFT_456859 [Annulohypoxylon moriforme]
MVFLQPNTHWPRKQITPCANCLTETRPFNHPGSVPLETQRTSRFDEYRKSLGHHNQPSHKSSKPHSPTVNVYTHCGRHTDQYLFGGWSDAFKHAFKKN